jgi:uncharacterized protein (UPF0276 family)
VKRDALTTPNPGFGLGLRTTHYGDFLAGPQPLDWLEIVTDNFLVDGGKPLVMLDRIRRDYPMVMHGVAMSLGAPDGPDMAYLQRVKTLADRIEPLWVSDHLCWIGPGPEQLHDLYPLPYTDEAAQRVITAIRAAQDVLQRRLVIENVSSYIDFKDSACSEWQFLSHIAQAADCLLLVDVNNIHVSSVNHGFNPLHYLDGLPAQRVQQIHLAGHADHGDYIVDTHDHPVAEPVWQLYREACQRFGGVATMIERDDHIPPLAELLDELAHAREIASESAAARTAPLSESIATRPQEIASGLSTSSCDALSTVQQDMCACMLSPAPTDPATLARLRTAPGIDASQRLGIYHHAYRARLSEVLADSFAKTLLYLGSDTFDEVATAYAVQHPPRHRSLGRFGAGLPAFLAERWPDNPELHELAQLDWDLRACFDGADVPALSATAAAADPQSGWLHLESPLHPSLQLRPVQTNVVALWKAIDADEEVPEAAALPAPRTLAVWRKDLQPHFSTVDPDQAPFVAAMAAGASILQTCEQLKQLPALADPQALSAWLAHWWAEGWLRTTPVTEGELLTS